MSEVLIGVEEIDAKYEVLEKLGEGGMGEIFRVRHRLLEEIRVIKTIRAQFREDPELQARFLHEARTATQLHHPSIAEIYDFSIADDGTACIVMEMIAGVDLAEYKKPDKLLAFVEVVEIGRQVLMALSYLHKKQFVHRDISPDNIMLTKDLDGKNLVKLIDLGIAKSLESSNLQTRTGFFIGKVKYASPEQLGGLQGVEVDRRSDLYSLGIVLCELLTGRFPITGTDEASMLAGHLFHPPRNFDEMDPGGNVPPPVRSVLMRALGKRPEERFSDADEMLAALDAAMEGHEPAPAPEIDSEAPTLVRPLAPAVASSQAAPAGARSRTPLILAAVAAVVLVAGGWLAGDKLGFFGASSEDSTADRGADATETAAALAGVDFGQFHALVIGNDDYLQLPRLETAANDAREVAELLESKYGFTVRLLTNADRYSMISALAEVAAAVGPNDNLLLYYAGHGWLDPQSQSGYWQPIDSEPSNTANWISTKYEVSAVLGRIAAKRVLVVADSCYSGSLSDPTLLDERAPLEGGDSTDRIRQLADRRARLALSSGGLSPVLDTGDGQHSVFSKILLETLRSNEGVFDSTALYEQISRRVSESAATMGADQTPQLAPISQAGDEGGEFFFITG